MKVRQKIKNFGKKTLIAGLVLGSLLGSGAKGVNAQERINSMPKRTIVLDMKNPLDTFEANSNAWYSLSQLAGKGNDLIGKKGKLDNYLLGRGALFVADYYFTAALEYYSHEIAHDFEFRKKGIKNGFNLDSKNMRNAFSLVHLDSYFNLPYPEYMQKPSSYLRLYEDEEAFFRNIVNGLNQDEFNAKTNWENSISKKYLDFCDATSFLATKFKDVSYVSGNFEDRRPDQRNFSLEEFVQHNFNDEKKNLWRDDDLYTNYLYNKGINLSKKDYFKQALTADLLSVHTWDSMKGIWNYLLKGKRSTKTTLFEVGKTKITPPLINHYLTSNGSFYDATSVINPRGKNSVKLSLGIDADFIGEGEVNHLRFGGEYQNIDVGKVKISPFIYVNTARSNLDYKGFSAGAKASLPVSKNVHLRSKVEYNQNDILENAVKGEENGFNFVAGIEKSF